MRLFALDIQLLAIGIEYQAAAIGIGDFRSIYLAIQFSLLEAIPLPVMLR